MSSMSSPNESVVVLSRALDQAGDVLAAVHDDQLSLPTPCEGWDVRRLVAHLVHAPRTFVAMAQGEEIDWAADPPPISSGWAADFRSGADDLIHLWHEAGDAAQGGQVDWQTAEFAVHTWDLAHAVGYPHELDAEAAERGLSFMSRSLTAENRGHAFGPPRSVPDDAPAPDRLAAFAGRDPHA
jgi:uncharacterized protein (TIGR03086 family)